MSDSGLINPPALRTGEERAATPLELFFDLAYILTVAELGSAFLEDLTWHGLLVLAGLFAAVWFSWVEFTLYANRFDTDDLVFRLAKLAGTLAIAGCAASAAEATKSTAVPFAACYLAGQVILIGLYARAWRHVPEVRPALSRYLGSTVIGAAMWAVSIGVEPPARFILWFVGAACLAVGPFLVTAHRASTPVHMEHLPERFGLFVILALGEVVAATVTGVHDGHWAASSVRTAVAGFVVAGGLWWYYFDVGGARNAETLKDDDDESDGRHDLFVYAHLPLTAGMMIAGVGLEELVLHPSEALPSPAGWALCMGTALYFLGATVLSAGVQQQWRACWPLPSVAIPAAACLGLIPFASIGVLPAGLQLSTLLAAEVVLAVVVGRSYRLRNARGDGDEEHNTETSPDRGGD